MYIGNDLQIAHPSYKIIDDISSGFNGSATSFALQVSGETPVPFPISTQQVMISVNGVVQEPDPNGGAGFKLLGSNIVFSSAPANGHAFFGVINAGADYVTAGSEFPDGSATAPSFTFQDDQDTGWFRNASGDVGYSSNGSAILNFDGNGLTIAAGKGLTVDTSTLKVDAANNRVGIGTTSPATELHVQDSSGDCLIRVTSADGNGAFLDLGDASDPDGGRIVYDTGSNLAFSTASNERMRINSSGRVGIGLTNPTSPLDITGGSDNTIIQIRSTDAGAYMTAIDNTGAGSFGQQGAATVITCDAGASVADSAIVFQIDANTERMRIDSSGRLLIGHTTTLVTEGSLQQQIVGTDFGTSGSALLRFQDGTSGPTIAFAHSRNGTKGSHTILADNDEFGKIRFYGSDGTDFNNYGAEIRAVVNGTPGANDMPGALTFGTTADGATGSTERMRITCTGKICQGTTTPRERVHFHYASSDENYLRFTNSTTGSAAGDGFNVGINSAEQALIWNKENTSMLFGTNGSTALTITNSQNATFAAAVSDHDGDLRNIPLAQKTSAYVLVAQDAGRAIHITTGGVTVNNSIFSAGNAVTIINDSGSDQTITQGSGVTIYNTADATTGNRTLAGRGMATIWFNSASKAYISGAGLS